MILGFDLAKKGKSPNSGVDTPEKGQETKKKALGLDATNWMKEKLDAAIKGDDELTIRTELVGAWVSTVVLLAVLTLARMMYR